MTLFTSHNNLSNTFIFPIIQGGNWSSEKFKCILWATHERTKHVYHFKSLYLWLVQTAWNPFWNTFEELLFGEFGIWKIKLEFLFQKAKNVKRAVPVTGTKLGGAEVDAYVDYSGVAPSFGSQGWSQQHTSASHL